MKRGDCYEAAAIFLLGHPRCPGIALVHGEVTGQGRIEGVRYGHAWVEIGDAVIDPSNGRMICMRKCFYYEIGEISTVVRYSPEEARQLLVKNLHYGPWDPARKRPGPSKMFGGG